VLYKCANPACLTAFRHMGQGKLFQIESEDLEAAASRPAMSKRKARSVHRIERYWLCDECGSSLTLTFDPGRGVVAVPLRDGARQIATTAHLRQIPRASGPPQANRGSRWIPTGGTWST
jgi:hypothetical protein